MTLHLPLHPSSSPPSAHPPPTYTSQHLKEVLKADQTSIKIPRKRCPGTVDAVLRRVITPLVTHVDLPPNITDEELVAVSAQCPNVRTLDVYQCGQLTDVAIAKMVRRMCVCVYVCDVCCVLCAVCAAACTVCVNGCE